MMPLTVPTDDAAARASLLIFVRTQAQQQRVICNHHAVRDWLWKKFKRSMQPVPWTFDEYFADKSAQN